MDDFEFRRQRVINVPETVAVKWSREVVNEGFVPFPKRLLRCVTSLLDGEDPLGELAVLLAIVDYRRPGLTRGPSLAFLAFVANMPVEKFRERLHRLEGKSLITVAGTDDDLKVDLKPLLERIVELTST